MHHRPLSRLGELLVLVLRSGFALDHEHRPEKSLGDLVGRHPEHERRQGRVGFTHDNRIERVSYVCNRVEGILIAVDTGLDSRVHPELRQPIRHPPEECLDIVVRRVFIRNVIQRYVGVHLSEHTRDDTGEAVDPDGPADWD